MKDVDGTRELFTCSQRAYDWQLMVSIADTGVGLPPQQADQIFNVFFTTKPQGTGMGTPDQPLHRGIARRQLVSYR